MSTLTWMRHPNHGRMPAYGNEEINRAIGHGWHVETPEEAPGYVPPATVEAAPIKRGPGRPRKQQ